MFLSSELEAPGDPSTGRLIFLSETPSKNSVGSGERKEFASKKKAGASSGIRTQDLRFTKPLLYH